MSKFVWELPPTISTTKELLKLVKTHLTESEGVFAAKLLQQRRITPETAVTFLSPDKYQPTSVDAFGQEIKLAITRLEKAINQSEKVTIWGDFDADGVTATSLLYSGLGEFFPDNLSYYIPNRLTESHGLNKPGIAKLATQGIKLIITCDNGSTNLAEINYAKELGIDIIITDHHSLPENRPEVVAILNPRYFAENHPLYHLSGVGIAYKLLEGVYAAWQQTAPPENLLDLVAIGLIADLVELKGDCRYLAQKGLQQLQRQKNWNTATRPGVYYLLEKCTTNGDRPGDISYGIGPRINAVSRIYGDSSLIVELLTAKDRKKCEKLAHQVELANTRRKELEKNTLRQVQTKAKAIDLSTTPVLVLAEQGWQVGILGLIANTIAREYNRPTILLSIEGKIARGSACSPHNLDLYELIKSQTQFLSSFGGHPYAAGLSLPVENLTLFTTAINQVARSKITNLNLQPILSLDLVVTVKDLGKNLFKELKLLEPYSMGNPKPQLLIKNCLFTEIKSSNIRDSSSQKIRYQKTTFLLQDQSTNQGFPGVWWGHSASELPTDIPCDVVVELDCNLSQQQYEVRLIDWQIAQENNYYQRSNPLNHSQQTPPYPNNWNPNQARDIWYQLIGIAKYLLRTGQSVTSEKLQTKLQISDRSLSIGLETLTYLGYTITNLEQKLCVNSYQPPLVVPQENIDFFLEILNEELFQKRYHQLTSYCFSPGKIESP